MDRREMLTESLKALRRALGSGLGTFAGLRALLGPSAGAGPTGAALFAGGGEPQSFDALEAAKDEGGD